MMIKYPVAYANHKLAEQTPEWPSWSVWYAWSEGQLINCYYTRVDDNIYELANINDPREPDLEDKRIFLTKLPQNHGEDRILIQSWPNDAKDDDELAATMASHRSDFLTYVP